MMMMMMSSEHFLLHYCFNRPDQHGKHTICCYLSDDARSSVRLSGCLVVTSTLLMYTMSGRKDRQYFRDNFDNTNIIVVIFCSVYDEGNAKLITQR